MFTLFSRKVVRKLLLQLTQETNDYNECPFKPRCYSEEEKAKAIVFYLKENLSCAKSAQRLGLHKSNLSRWLRQYRIDQGEALPVNSGLLSELSNEKDFFKLAAAHFAKKQLAAARTYFVKEQQAQKVLA